MDKSLFIPFAILFYIIVYYLVRRFWGNWIAEKIENISVFWLIVMYFMIALSLLPLHWSYGQIVRWLIK